MNVVPWLTDRIPPLAVSVGTVGDRAVSVGTLVVLFVGIFVTWAVSTLAGRRAHARLGRSEDAAPVVQRLVAEFVRWPIALLGVGITLDVAGLVSFATALAALHAAANFELIELAGVHVSLATLLSVVVILALTWWLSWLAQRAIRRVAKRGVLGTNAGTVGVAERLVHYAVLGVGATIALQAVGIDLSAMFAAGAVFAVGIGFAMQEIAQNFVSGVILLVEGAIKPGDVLEVDGRVVRVTKMGIRATVVRTRDDEDVIVPNTMLAQGMVKNLTMTDDRLRIRLPVGVSYDSDMRRVMEVLRSTAMAFSPRAPRDPVVLLTAFGSSSVDFEVSVWITNPWDSRQRASELLQAIWWALKDGGIVIAYPQLDLHLDPAVARAISPGA